MWKLLWQQQGYEHLYNGQGPFFITPILCPHETDSICHQSVTMDHCNILHLSQAQITKHSFFLNRFEIMKKTGLYLYSVPYTIV